MQLLSLKENGESGNLKRLSENNKCSLYVVPVVPVIILKIIEKI